MTWEEIDDAITLGLGTWAYRVWAALMPIYTTVEEANDPTRNGLWEYRRYPFLIVWPLRWMRDVEIAWLTWKVRRRNGANGQREH